ncbi:MAG: 3-oxoacyl-[acyl-carrier-protein] reductase [Anaerolineae bacterium]|nr:3-oxoacyl-[acyl-carrier-protein] reductase [Anaerolineae bacterium]
MSNLEGSVALVTGSGQGIGCAVVQALVLQKAIVCINDRDQERAQGTVDWVNEVGGECLSVPADVSDCDAVQEMFQKVVDAYGKIDILVNNAGVTRDNLLMRMSEEEWDLVMAVNLKSVFNCCKAAVRHMMRKRYGRIVNMSSVSGIAGQVGQVNYSASKAGIIGFTKALAREVASRNITVNAVAPSFVQTPMTDGLADRVGAEAMKQLNAAIPMGRWATPEEVAHAVLFFCTPEVGYITGQVLSVDGGMVMG